MFKIDIHEAEGSYLVECLESCFVEEDKCLLRVSGVCGASITVGRTSVSGASTYVWGEHLFVR